ncbi:uncharacterized protein LOC132722615 isoform X2 [Ruditapes philippinarum]|uniref:uncharacterized protein LOC132722615 isoform X2 n=1 Tax=Ruditapes philippinarum TaxID=129788 RepID=UPI00295B85AA|nr:uncharacterized protein LOC132722615 isoform X2 [Ruditapes philippinarum]
MECQPSSLQIEQSSSACHGPYSDETTVNATCNNGQVIAINRVTLGSKLQSTGCPPDYNASHGFSACCTNDQTNDCTFSLYQENYNYHRRCNGQQTCKEQTQVQQTTGCTQGSFTTLSRYMFMEYYCIEDDKMVELCSATTSTLTRENTTIYIWNTDFEVSTIKPSDPSCNCSVEIDNCDAYIDIYKMYRILTGNGNGMCNQTIRIGSGEDSTVLYEWTCSDNKQDIENFQAQVTYILVNLENTRNDTDGKVWMGFQATQNSNITISCPPTTQQYCKQTTTSTTMVTTSTTTENMTSTTTTEPSTTTTTTIITSPVTHNVTTAEDNSDERDDFLAVVIALGVLSAILLIVVMILSCCLYRTCRTKSNNDIEKVPVENKPSLQQPVMVSIPELPARPTLKDFACQVQLHHAMETKDLPVPNVNSQMNEIRIQRAEIGCQVTLTESDIVTDFMMSEEKSTQTEVPSLKHKDKGVSTEAILQSNGQSQTDMIKTKSQKSQANIKTEKNVQTTSSQTDIIHRDETKQEKVKQSTIVPDKTPIKPVANGNIQAFVDEDEAAPIKMENVIISKHKHKKRTKKKKRIPKSDDERDIRNTSPDTLDITSVDTIKDSPANRRFLFTPEKEVYKPEPEMSQPETVADSYQTDNSDTESPDTHSREVRPIQVRPFSPTVAKEIKHVYKVRSVMASAFFTQEKNEEKLLHMIRRQSKKKRVKKRKDSHC